jgi:4-amino-4-deoxy-L-arabinose transferase-like glycosyltransferase
MRLKPLPKSAVSAFMRRDYLLVIGLALLFFLPFLGSVHLFDWDEINFAECAREMLLTGDWFRPQIDFEPFWEKPPLFLWMQALSMQVFGVGEFAARLPNALCGLATLLLVYRLGLRLHDRLFAWLWVLAWIGSLLPHLYFRSGIIDPWFNFFIFCGLYGFIEFRWQFFTVKQSRGFWASHRYLLLGGALLGLGILTKGPTAYLIAFLVLVAYWARYRFRGKGYLKHLAMFSLAAALPAVLWFGLEFLLHGSWFIREFIVYQIRLFATPDSGHGGFPGYHAVVLLLGCFPISVFALPNLWGDKQSEDEMLESDTLAACIRSDFGTWMQLLFWVVLILFSLVRTKIVHYSSLCYFPLTYLGCVTLWRAIRWNIFPKVSGVALVIGLLLGGLVAALPYFGQNISLIKPLFTRDAFAMANLEAQVEWHLWQGLPGLILVLASVVGMVLWFKKRAWLSAQVALCGGAAFTSMSLLFLVCNIEGYSQRAAIEFYEAHCGEDCYVKTIGFKSYAHLFYTCKQPLGTLPPTIDDPSSLLNGNPGKKVYFVAKVNNLSDLPQRPDCHELYRKNGFVFFERNKMTKR